MTIVSPFGLFTRPSTDPVVELNLIFEIKNKDNDDFVLLNRHHP
jgi:hypothetical protein